MELSVLIGVGCILLFAATVQSITGFGFALMAVPLLTLVIDAKEAVALATLVGALASFLLLLRTHRDVRWELVRRLLGAAVLGMPIGLLVLLAVDARVLKLIIATAVLAFVVLLARGWRIEQAAGPVDLVAGFVSGVLNTAVSTNGPPLVLALQARGLPPEQFRATISAVFVGSSAVANVLFASAGRYDRTVLGYAALGPVALVAGSVIGQRLGRRLPAARFRPLVLGLLVLAAVSAGTSAALG